MCLSTIAIRQNGGFIHVACGRCIECLQKRRNDWTFRLKEEHKVSKSAYFVTLTYDEENLPTGGSLVKKDLQKFMKRLRKKQSKYTEQKIRYYGIGEYGSETERPHYHILLFNVLESVILGLDSVWKFGQHHIGQVNSASIHYCSKYMIVKNDHYGERERPFSCMSTKPYIGYSYIDEVRKNFHRNTTKEAQSMVYLSDGIKLGMPRIYKQKLFNRLEQQSIGKSQFKEKLNAENSEMVAFATRDNKRNNRDSGDFEGIKSYSKRKNEISKSKERTARKSSKSKIV